MLYRYSSSRVRLDAWRKWSAEIREGYAKRGASSPAEYEPGTLPPKWFGALSPASVNHEPTDPDGKPRTPTYNYGDGLGTGRTPDRPFRFVGFADEVVRLNHTGWFADEHGDTIYRGVVFQLPARGGNTIYLAGAEWGESSRKGFDTGGGWIEIGPRDMYESKEDAAHAANSIAEYAAEAEREYQEAERARIEEEEEEAERLAEEKEAEHASAVASTLETVLKTAGEVCNSIGAPGCDIIPDDVRALIDRLEDALNEYDTLTAQPAE